MDEHRPKLSAWDVELANAYSRDVLMQEMQVCLPDKISHHNKRIVPAPIPLNSTMAYDDIPVTLPPITKEEEQRLIEFRDEATRVAFNTPAIRDRISELWKGVARGGKQTLLDSFCDEEGLKGTRVAYIIEAACSFLDHDEANVLRCCTNARSYRFGMCVAQWYKQYCIAQRMAEEIMDDVQEDMVQALCDLSIHTGNAEFFCEVFEEYLEGAEDDAGLKDVCEMLLEFALYLLENKHIESNGLNEREIVAAVRKYYSSPLAPLDEMIDALMHEREAPATFTEQKVSTSPVPIAPIPESPAPAESPEPAIPFDVLRQTYKDNLFTQDKALLPIEELDAESIRILDRLLAADAPEIGEYRIPLLIRMAYDLKGSRKALQRYIGQLEDAARQKRKDFKKDRRWKMFKAIERFMDTGQGMEDALREAQGADEPRLLQLIAAKGISL